MFKEVIIKISNIKANLLEADLLKANLSNIDLIKVDDLTIIKADNIINIKAEFSNLISSLSNYSILVYLLLIFYYTLDLTTY